MTTDGKIREALAQKLRVTTAQMARRCSVDLMLWSMHSNACLEAAAILSTQKEREEERRMAWGRINEHNALSDKVKILEAALREIDAGIFIDNGDVTCLPVYAVRAIIARALGSR